MADHRMTRLSPNMIIQPYADQLGQFTLNCNLSKLFPIINKVKQSCVRLITLYTFFCRMILMQFPHDSNGDDSLHQISCLWQPV